MLTSDYDINLTSSRFALLYCDKSLRRFSFKSMVLVKFSTPLKSALSAGRTVKSLKYNKTYVDKIMIGKTS